MKKQDIRTKLEKNGYKVTAVINGGYVAKKGNQTYSAETLNQLIKKIF